MSEKVPGVFQDEDGQWCVYTPEFGLKYFGTTDEGRDNAHDFFRMYKDWESNNEDD